MRSLFVKIFLYFLLTIVLSTAIGMVLTYSRDHEFQPMGHRHFAKQALTEYGRSAVEAYEKGGAAGLQRYAQELREAAEVRVFLFSSRGEALTALRAAQPGVGLIKRLARRALRTGQMVFSERKNLPWMASPLVGASGQAYVIVVGLPERPPMRHLFKALPPGFFGARVLVMLGVAALFCFLLARSLTAPIRKLRRATHQFADGDLATRIGSAIEGKGEITDLGRDFDFMAERIESLITAQKRLLQDISHELRSPLARLSVALELARQRSGADAHEALGRIEKESSQLNDMIGQLLSLARLESGAGSYPLRTFALDALLRSVVADAAYEAGGGGREVLLGDCRRIAVTGPEELLRRAIENVVRNALKYTAPDTAVEVSLRLDQASGWALIRVRDHGPGVPPEALEKLFQPFFRVADARDRKSGGTGIGLAIADRAIRLGGGTIRAENRPEGGLDVLITLPPASEKA